MERKITVRNASGLTAAEIQKAGRKEKTALFNIMGQANKTKTHLHEQYGESIGLMGRFESTNAATGEVLVSPIFWPPQFLAQTVAAELLGDVESVVFGYEIGVKPSDNQFGYEYYFDPFHEAEAHDPFKELRQNAPSAVIEDKSDSKEKAK